MKETVEVMQVAEDLNVGGLEVFLRHLAIHLDAASIKQRFCCLRQGGSIAREIEEMGRPVDVLGLTSFYRWSQVMQLVRYFRHFRPDVVHTHGEFASTFGRLAAYLAGVPVVLRHIQTKANLSWNHRLFDGVLTRLTAGAIAVSEDCALHHRRLCRIPHSKMMVVPNGADLRALDAAMAHDEILSEFGLAKDVPVIGSVGRLNAIKGQKYLIRAMPQILSRYPNAKLVLVGEGEQMGLLKDEAKRLDIGEAVIFAGMRRDVLSFYRMFTVFVLASTHVEGLPLVIAEAMGARTPVVATDVGGTKEIVRPGKTGVLVRPRSAVLLADAILHLLDHPNEALKMAENARRLCENEFSIEKIVGRIAGVYRFCLAGKNVGSPDFSDPAH